MSPGSDKPPWLNRRKIFDGLTPADFVARGGTWPTGQLVNILADRVPADLPPDERELRQRDAALAFAAVRQLADEVRRYLEWKGVNRRSEQWVASQIGVSRDRLSGFEEGTRFPEWDLPYRLRALIAREEARRNQPG